jgi:hypothetical protein
MTRRIAIGVLVCLLPSVALARPIDKRAQVTVQASPLECVAVWSRLRGLKLTTPAESDAHRSIARAFGFADIDKRVAAADKKPLRDADFAGPRTPRNLDRGALDQLVKWLAPSVDRPLPAESNEVLSKLTDEFAEVLVGRDPYRE